PGVPPGYSDTSTISTTEISRAPAATHAAAHASRVRPRARSATTTAQAIGTYQPRSAFHDNVGSAMEGSTNNDVRPAAATNRAPWAVRTTARTMPTTTPASLHSRRLVEVRA